MDEIKFKPLADLLIKEIYSLTERYNENMKNGGKFSDAKVIRGKIKELTKELRKILQESEG